MMNKVKQLKNQNCNTPSSEPYRIKLYNVLVGKPEGKRPLG
jgi:hypothetical protein